MSALAEWARTAPSDKFWLVTVIFCGLAAASLIAAIVFFYRKRLFEDLPTSKIRSAAMGYVEFDGIGELLEGPPITAPLTGSTCTWYDCHVEEKRSSGKNSSWVTIRKDLSDEIFLIRDDTGQCVVDPEGARVTPSVKHVWYGNTPLPQYPPGPASSKPGWKPSLPLGMGRYRYTEKRMHPGDPLYAIGLFRTEGGAGGNFDINEDVRELLREWKRDADAMLARFDTNQDGEICMEEWQAVRESAFKEVHKRHAEEKVSMPAHILGKTCDRRRPYILSALPEPDLVMRYKYFYRGGLLAFFVTGALASWLIGLRLAG